MSVNIIPYCPSTPASKKSARLARGRAKRNVQRTSPTAPDPLPPTALNTDELDRGGLVSMDRRDAAHANGIAPMDVTFTPVVTLAAAQLRAAGDGRCVTFQDALDALDSETHQIRMDLVAKKQADNATGKTYGRHVQNYVAWWEERQNELSKLDPGCVRLPAEPITPAKAFLFINSERSRKKRKASSGEEVVGTALGRHAISQVISALEARRKDCLHKFRKDPDPDVRIALRDDERIREIEAAAKHDEPKRIANAQALKAAGTSADTYTEAQLFTVAKRFLDITAGPKKLAVEIRDRALVLTAACTAFRGDSQRILLWSDLFVKEIPIHEIAIGHKIMALAVLADNAKHNQHGRVDEFGAIRHRHVELCAISALALHFFSYFHVLDNPLPLLQPDFNNRDYGEYGHRPWYSSHVFPGKTLDSEMSYENHRTRIRTVHEHADIVITKVTHAGRVFAGTSTRSHGSSMDDTKALGGWNERSGVFRSCYDRALPLPALLGASMFNGRDPGSYNLPRDVLDPPLSVTSQIFPWIEAEEALLKLRQNANAHARDLALTQFLKVLRWFRHVLVQDMAVLYSSRPQALIFTFSPFNTLNFRQFASGAKLKIDAAEETARLRLQNLPENLVRGVQGAMTNMDLKLEQDREASAARLATLENNLDGLKELLTEALAKPLQKRRRVSDSPAASLAGTPPPVISRRNSRPLYSPPALAAASSSMATTLPALHSQPSRLPTPSSADFEEASAPTFEHVAMPLTSPSHLQQLPSHGLLPTIAHSNVTIIMPSVSPTQPLCPLPGAFEAPHFTTQPAAAPVDVSMQVAEPVHFEGVPHTLTPPVNRHGAGTLSSMPAHALHQLTPPHGQPDDPRAAAKWMALVNKHRNTNISQHPTWSYTNGEWIPVYEYQRAQSIMGIWDEWVDGHAPYLSVRFMTDVWGAKWRFNDHSLKTEACRRSKVINLVEMLQKKPGWNVALVRRFLEEKYGSFTARRFCDYLTKNLDAVLAAASAYP